MGLRRRVLDRIRFFNRRWFNPLILRMAGGRRSPFCILSHTGRRSGRAYRTPLIAVRQGEGFVFALTYGPHVDWHRNVLAAGACTLRWRGADHYLEGPQALASPQALPSFPFLLRYILRLNRIEDFVRLDPSAAPGAGARPAGRGAARPGGPRPSGAAEREAPRVRLREVQASDLAAFFEHQRDPQAVGMASFPARDHEAFAAHWERVLADRANTVRTIDLGGGVAGYVAAFPLNGKTFIGYWLGRAYWGRGVATEALRQFLDVVAGRPLHAFVARHNAASVRVLEKCGFTLSEQDAQAGGTADELMYVLTAGAHQPARAEEGGDG